MSRTIELVTTSTVACDGDETHPLVYYTLKEYKDGQTKAACHYCGKLYVYKNSLKSNDIL